VVGVVVAVIVLWSTEYTRIGVVVLVAGIAAIALASEMGSSIENAILRPSDEGDDE
jgi:hypothetical protein